MALTYATLLRVFPGFIVAALILKALARMVRAAALRDLARHLRFAAGCIIALAVLLPGLALGDRRPRCVAASSRRTARSTCTPR